MIKLPYLTPNQDGIRYHARTANPAAGTNGISNPPNDGHKHLYVDFPGREYPLEIDAVVLDLDGSLLNNKGNLSLRTRGLISILKEKGIEIILSTGRAPGSAKPHIQILHQSSNHSILYHGARIQVKYADVASHQLTKGATDIVDAFYTSLKEIDQNSNLQPEIVGWVEDTAYHRKTNSELLGEYQSRNGDGLPFFDLKEEKPNPDKFLGKGYVDKFVVLTENPEQAQIMEKLIRRKLSHKTLSFTRSNDTYFEIWSGETNKGVAAACYGGRFSVY